MRHPLIMFIFYFTLTEYFLSYDWRDFSSEKLEAAE